MYCAFLDELVCKYMRTVCVCMPFLNKGVLFVDNTVLFFFYRWLDILSAYRTTWLSLLLSRSMTSHLTLVYLPT